MKFKSLMGVYGIVAIFSLTILLGANPCQAASSDGGMPMVTITQDEWNQFFTENPLEIRNVVTVPFDPFKSNVGKDKIENLPEEIPLLTRLIPKDAFTGTTPGDWQNDSSAKEKLRNQPTILFIYGGPARTDKSTLKRQWEPNDPEYTLASKLHNWNKLANVILIGQRGSPGGMSVPLDQSDIAKLNFSNIYRFFNQAVQAYDYHKVLQYYENLGLIDIANTVVIGHSAGVTVAQQLIKIRNEGWIDLKPAGIVLASGVLTFGSTPAESWLSTRPQVVAYNKSVLEWSIANAKPIRYDELIMKIRTKVAELGGDPNIIHHVYGYSLASMNEQETIYNLAEQFWKDLNDPAKEFNDTYTAFARENSDAFNPLLSILMWTMFGNGPTELAAIPAPELEPYMFDPIIGMAQEEIGFYDKLEKMFVNPLPEYPVDLNLSDVRKYLDAGNKIVVQEGAGDTVASSIAVMEKSVKAVNRPQQIFAVPTTGAHRDLFWMESICQFYEKLQLQIDCKNAQ